MLNFWASWCGPCENEAPVLERAQRGWPAAGGTVLGVTYKDDAAASRDFVRKYKLTYPSLRDDRLDLAPKYGTTKLPETFVLDKAGHVVAMSRGEVSPGLPLARHRPGAGGADARRRGRAAGPRCALALAPDRRSPRTPRASFNDVEDEVMCDTCNVPLNIAESDRADQERAEIRRLIARGLTKQQILAELERTYGPAILAKPQDSGFSLAVWWVPVAVVRGARRAAGGAAAALAPARARPRRRRARRARAPA